MRHVYLSRLYSILSDLKSKQGYHYLSNAIPLHFNCGLYFFFDPQNPINQHQFKIIYIGITKDNSSNRLKKHQRGNISDSSFRQHVGKAFNLLHDENFDRVRISAYIHQLPYLFLPINNIENLKKLEKECIEIISNKIELNKNQVVIHPPLDGWLGYEIGGVIAVAQMWNSDHTGNYNPQQDYTQTLEMLEDYVNTM